MNFDYKELDKLEEYLKEKGIKYKRSEDRWMGDDKVTGQQIIVFDENGERQWDAILNKSSYGREKNLLEIMGSPVVKDSDNDTVVGWLTADDIIKRLEDTNE